MKIIFSYCFSRNCYCDFFLVFAFFNKWWGVGIGLGYLYFIESLSSNFKFFVRIIISNDWSSLEEGDLDVSLYIQFFFFLTLYFTFTFTFVFIGRYVLAFICFYPLPFYCCFAPLSLSPSLSLSLSLFLSLSVILLHVTFTPLYISFPNTQSCMFVFISLLEQVHSFVGMQITANTLLAKRSIGQ